uniref:Uncharacterized protein MANES_02G057000 n=1 Tax=Rhizophora mucronata TaxID=61149 RepID=A0A2P2JHW5_RHIMU
MRAFVQGKPFTDFSGVEAVAGIDLLCSNDSRGLNFEPKSPVHSRSLIVTEAEEPQFTKMASVGV